MFYLAIYAYFYIFSLVFPSGYFLASHIVQWKKHVLPNHFHDIMNNWYSYLQQFY